jgi:hypothetical protein
MSPSMDPPGPCAALANGPGSGETRRMLRLPLAGVLLASALKITPAEKAERRARRRESLKLLRLAVRKEKAERSERHATQIQQPREGRPRTRRPSWR